MEYFVGIDVSLDQSSICVVDATGKLVREAKAASDPEVLGRTLAEFGCKDARVGLEAGALSEWLYAGLTGAGIDAVLLETRHVQAALSAMAVKTDRNDARGIAQLLRLGWYKSVHAKSAGAQEIRMLLTGRKLLQRKLIDLELGMRGMLRAFGLKVGKVSRGRFEARLRALIDCNAMLETVIGGMLNARAALMAEFARLHRAVLKLVRVDDVCRRLMTTPGVGAIAAVTFKAAVDDPGRFRSSQALGAHFGLTPRKYQSGETDFTGHITKAGDASVRTVLYEAANAIITLKVRPSSLKTWALGVVKRRGAKRAKVALARKLSVILHRMWVDGTEFRSGREEVLAAA